MSDYYDPNAYQDDEYRETGHNSHSDSVYQPDTEETSRLSRIIEYASNADEKTSDEWYTNEYNQEVDLKYNSRGYYGS